MDYRALAELIMLSLMGLSVLAVAVGFSIRAFLAPVIRDVLGARQTGRDKEQQRLEVRLDQVEERLAGIESAVHRIAAVEEFNRALRSGSPPTDESVE